MNEISILKGQLLLLSRRFQSSHPRGVRLMTAIILPYLSVSIHAPARGATEYFICDHCGCSVSIHAPARGATFVIRTLMSPSCFNPRTREGCDTRPPAACPCTQRFNPRTREGCDPDGVVLPSHVDRFNPRTREGCDVSPLLARRPSTGFQSTHPRGVRLRAWSRLVAIGCFNPRTREGCDCKCHEQW